MRDRTQSILASVLAALAGAGLMLVPVFTSVTGASLTNMLIVGGVFALSGLVQLFWVNTWPSWINGLASIWALVSAFAFSMNGVSRWSMAVVAVVTFVLSVWDGIEIDHVQHREHHLRI